MFKIGNKYCYVKTDLEEFTRIVRQSYEATKHEPCLKAGFVPIELLEQRDTGWVVCVPTMNRIGNVCRYMWEVSNELLGTLELIGDAGMQPMAVEMWRLKRSLEILKRQTITPLPQAAQPQPIIETAAPEVIAIVPKPIASKTPKPEKVKPIPTPWPEVEMPKGIKVVRTYVDGSQILDDGKERWLNADWTQPVKYVCR